MSKTLSYIPLLLICLSALLASCNNDDSTGTDIDPDLADAQLKDFPLSEVDYLKISIVHPELDNGVEKKPGEIEVTIPALNSNDMKFSLKQFDLDGDKYSIDPAVGSIQDFSNGPVVYAIASKHVENREVHYQVTIVKADPAIENYKILGLTFDQSKNPALPGTIEAFKIVEYAGFSQNAIYVFVPEGTDFSQLTPTILYDAAAVFYNNGVETKLYPEAGTTIDFQYPKRFTIYAENSFGVRSKIYNVIVDVKNPIKFEATSVIAPNVKVGDGSGFELLSGIATWTNIGNHPISSLSTSEYKNKVFPVDGVPADINIITATLFNPTAGTPGVLPGETGTVDIKVSRAMVEGTYKTTASFLPTFNFNTHVISSSPAKDLVEGIFEPVELEIQATLEE
jgi:predicted small secreted protein